VSDQDERWIKALQRDIMDTRVNIGCRIAQQQLKLRDILDMKEGDVIPIEMPESIILSANGIPIFKTRLGSSRENLALKIISPLQHNR
jgi:flagellar motor switch protein FliM